jgi:nitrogen PTS system EIIA component
VLKEFITQDSIWLAQDISCKMDLLTFIAKKTAPMSGQSYYALLEGLNTREALQTTAVGKGIAIPHCVLPQLNDIYTGFVQLKNPIDFGASDYQACDLFFFIIASQNAGTDYLRVLARASRLLRDGEICTKLRTAKVIPDILSLIG